MLLWAVWEGEYTIWVRVDYYCNNEQYLRVEALSALGFEII